MEKEIKRVFYMEMENSFKWFNNIKDILFFIIALAGVITAILGLRTWRKQIKANIEIDLAKRILKLVYQIYDKVKHTRRLLNYEEYENELLKEGAKPKHAPSVAWGNSLYSYRESLDEIQELQDSLKIERLEAELYWGNEFENIIEDFDNHIRKLRITLNEFNHDNKEEKKDQVFPILYDRKDESGNNEYANKLKISIKEIERFIKPKLRL